MGGREHDDARGIGLSAWSRFWIAVKAWLRHTSPTLFFLLRGWWWWLRERWQRRTDYGTVLRRSLSKARLGVPAPVRVAVVPLPGASDTSVDLLLASARAQRYLHWRAVRVDSDGRGQLLSAASARPASAVASQPPEAQLAEAIAGGGFGDWFLLAGDGVVLSEGAMVGLSEAVLAYPEARMIFFDHEEESPSGHRVHTKPVFDPVRLSVDCYLGPCIAVHRSLLFAGDAQQFRLPDCSGYTRWVQQVAQELPMAAVVHIPVPLFRVIEEIRAASPPAPRAGATSTAAAAPLRRAEERDAVKASRTAIIIPTRDGMPHLEEAVRSAVAALEAHDLEGQVLVVDNGSREEATAAYLAKALQQYPERLRVLPYDAPFNYSRIHNWAVRDLDADYLLLLNDDVSSMDDDWLWAMLQWMVRRTDVGAVGARLLYPDGSLQHGGVVLGLGIGAVAGHVGVRLPPTEERLTQFGATVPRTVSAVTAACMLTRLDIYESVGGLDEVNLTVAFNDIDYCLKVRGKGHRIVYEPRATLYHHESLTRGQDLSSAKRERFLGEIEYMHRHWGQALTTDPYYNPNLNLTTADLTLRSTPDISRVLPRRDECLCASESTATTEMSEVGPSLSPRALA